MFLSLPENRSSPLPKKQSVKTRTVRKIQIRATLLLKNPRKETRTAHTAQTTAYRGYPLYFTRSRQRPSAHCQRVERAGNRSGHFSSPSSSSSSSSVCLSQRGGTEERNLLLPSSFPSLMMHSIFFGTIGLRRRRRRRRRGEAISAFRSPLGSRRASDAAAIKEEGRRRREGRVMGGWHARKGSGSGGEKFVHSLKMMRTFKSVSTRK